MAADPRAPGPQPPDTSGGGEYPRRVIIRFRPSFQPKKDRLEPRDLPGWDEVLRQFPSLTPPRRLVPSQTDGAKAIEKLVSRAKQRDERDGTAEVWRESVHDERGDIRASRVSDERDAWR